MTDDERAVRMAMEHAALVAAVRRYVTEQGHRDRCWCFLCQALAKADRQPTPTSTP